MNIVTDTACASYSYPGHPESPERITKTVARLREQQELTVSWVDASPAKEAALLRAHTAEHLASLSAGEHFDADTPFYVGIDQRARVSAGAAIKCMKLALDGQPSFSLMRPPGHHASQKRAMGFCYLSNVAIACLEALAAGIRRVAVFDFDVHHGNGTEAILLNQNGAVFTSVHQYPCYPGTGLRDVGDNCFNYPVPPHAPRQDHREILSAALERVLQLKPALLAVSAGFDCYANDPLAQENLEAEDFHWLGQKIRQTGVPAFSVLEGGYSRDLPELVMAYLKGLEGK